MQLRAIKFSEVESKLGLLLNLVSTVPYISASKPTRTSERDNAPLLLNKIINNNLALRGGGGGEKMQRVIKLFKYIHCAVPHVEQRGYESI